MGKHFTIAFAESIQTSDSRFRYPRSFPRLERFTCSNTLEPIHDADGNGNLQMQEVLNLDSLADLQVLYGEFELRISTDSQLNANSYQKRYGGMHSAFLYISLEMHGRPSIATSALQERAMGMIIPIRSNPEFLLVLPIAADPWLSGLLVSRHVHVHQG